MISAPRSLALRLGSLALFGVVLMTGCGPSLQDVSGTVTSGGKPLPDVQVTFMDDKGEVFTGRSDASGAYKVAAPPAKYKVSLAVPPDKATIPDSSNPYAAPKLPFPEKYAGGGSSGLEFEVKSGANQYEIKAD